MKKLFVAVLVVTLFPALTASQKSDEFKPFVGKWIGVSCGNTNNEILAYRIEFRGTQDDPYLVIKEAANKDDFVNLQTTVHGKYLRNEGTFDGKPIDGGNFDFETTESKKPVHWKFATPFQNQSIKGLLVYRPDYYFSLQFEPDSYKKGLATYWRESQELCR